jgi:hypothetical protein
MKCPTNRLTTLAMILALMADLTILRPTITFLRSRRIA